MNPMHRFNAWFEEAKNCRDIVDATVMCLATADKHGIPSARIVLLKELEENGLVFYTNLGSHKSTDIKENPNVSLVFFWAALGKQVRIQGMCEQVSDAQADNYFATRPRDSQIGAWASIQSQPLSSRKEFEDRITQYTAQFDSQPVPRPPHWSGWRVVPRVIEFWTDIEFRLHDRDVYTREGDGWKVTKLYP